MGKIETLKAKAIADNVKKVDGKKKSVRSIDLDNIGKGDTFVLAEKQIYERKIGTNTADFVYVYRVGNDGKVTEDATMLYLGSLTRVVAEYAEDLTRTGNIVRASGTAVDAIQKCATWDEALDFIEGKKITVSDSQEVETRNFNDPTTTRKQTVFTFDFVA